MTWIERITYDPVTQFGIRSFMSFSMPHVTRCELCKPSKVGKVVLGVINIVLRYCKCHSKLTFSPWAYHTSSLRHNKSPEDLVSKPNSLLPTPICLVLQVQPYNSKVQPQGTDGVFSGPSLGSFEVYLMYTSTKSYSVPICILTPRSRMLAADAEGNP